MGAMGEFIVNPRRAPRAPARCRAGVGSSVGYFEAETEDIGTMGCQVVSPKLLRKGDALQLHITNPKVESPLKVTGRVAWVSPQAPWRVGIAFDEASLREAGRWFDALIVAYPGLGGYRRVPDRIRADATVYLGPPPKFLVDFSGDEAMLLRSIASGARIDELMARLRDRWPAAQRALFSLIARGTVTFVRGQAVHPESWKKILTDVEASLAVEELGRSGSSTVVAPPPFIPIHPGSPLPPATSPIRNQPGRPPEQAPAPERALELQPEEPDASLELEPMVTPGSAGSMWTKTPPPMTSVSAWTKTPLPPSDFDGAGVGWRKARQRSPEAQATFDQALAEIQAGATNRAIALLRRALQLAPGDPDIAAQLGKLAFKDRMPGAT
jgi:hypothetical protein